MTAGDSEAEPQRPLDPQRLRGAVIFDRDGVLNEDVGFAHRPDQIRWVGGAVAAIKAGELQYILSNEKGDARAREREDRNS